MITDILLIEDDPAASLSIKEILGNKYSVTQAPDVESALKMIGGRKFNLAILDHDLKGEKGLGPYLKIRRIDPTLKVVMISLINDVSVAVSAAKMGVVDFLRKPLEAEKLREVISRHIAKSEEAPRLILTSKSAWLIGASEIASSLLTQLKSLAASKDDVLVFGEMGIDKRAVAELIHKSGPLSARRFSSIDLMAFNKESSEGLFWSTVQELLEDRTGKTDEEDLCGTVMLSCIERVSDHFAMSILEFLRKRRTTTSFERLDKLIRVIVSAEDAIRLSELETKGYFEGFSKLNIPTLRERKEDIPILISACVDQASSKYSKSVKGISAEALRFMSFYRWPGNYRQLESFLTLAVLNMKEDVISLKEMPVDADMVTEVYLKESDVSGILSLGELDQGFEKKFIGMVIDHAGGDEGRAASFLDIPKTAFQERIKTLGLTGRRA